MREREYTRERDRPSEAERYNECDEANECGRGRTSERRTCESENEWETTTSEIERETK